MGHNLTVTCLVLLPKHVYGQLSNRVRYKPLARMRSDGYGGYPVCVCVSESTIYYSRAAGYDAVYERYQQL